MERLAHGESDGGPSLRVDVHSRRVEAGGDIRGASVMKANQCIGRDARIGIASRFPEHGAGGVSSCAPKTSHDMGPHGGIAVR